MKKTRIVEEDKSSLLDKKPDSVFVSEEEIAFLCHQIYGRSLTLDAAGEEIGISASAIRRIIKRTRVEEETYKNVKKWIRKVKNEG